MYLFACNDVNRCLHSSVKQASCLGVIYVFYLKVKLYS